MNYPITGDYDNGYFNVALNSHYQKVGYCTFLGGEA